MPTVIKIDGSVPIELKQAAVDWSHVLLSNIPFLVTIVVVVAAAAVNYYVNRRTIDKHEIQSAKARQAEHQNKISEYRHGWLQELRNTAAELVRAIHEAQNTLMQMNLSRDYADQASTHGDEELEAMYRTQVKNLYEREKAVAAEIYKFNSKIKLLFKKGDPKAVQLFRLLDDVRDKLGDNEIRQLNNGVIDEIVIELQIILKDEWEVTKERISKEIVK